MSKRILSILLTLALLASLLPAALAEDIEIVEPETVEEPVGADAPGGPEEIALVDPADNAVVSSGACGPNLQYTLDDTGTLTISGSGEMFDYPWQGDDFRGFPWMNFRSEIKAVVLEDGLTVLPEYCFRRCENLRTVTMGKTLTTIGSNAFLECGALEAYVVSSKNATFESADGVLFAKGGQTLLCFPFAKSGDYAIPEGVSTVAVNAFASCKALTAVTIPDSVTSLGAGAFFSCEGLTEVRGGANIESLGDSCFQQCVSLTTISLGKKLTAIPGGAFMNCGGLTEMVIPDGVTKIDYYAFAYCWGLERVSFGSGLTGIEDGAFTQCESLTELRFRGAAPQISRDAFRRVTATAHYPVNDPSWTEEVRQNYGGTLTWEPYEPVLGPFVPSPVLDGMSTAGVALGWPAGDGVEKIEVQRKLGGGEWKTLKTTDALGIVDADVQMGKTYTYRLRAKIDGEWGDWGSELEVFFNPFTDVSGTKTVEYVAWAYNNEIVKGTSTTAFKPDNPCTRIQFVMMLWKMHGSPIVDGENPFSDISGTKTTNAIRWALKAGVINPAGKFFPDDNISRIQIVMMLWKLAGSPNAAGDNPFEDVSGSKTTKAVLWAYQNGITKGTSATKFSPDKDCTRVQLVIFLYKYNGIYHVI